MCSQALLCALFGLGPAQCIVWVCQLAVVSCRIGAVGGGQSTGMSSRRMVGRAVLARSGEHTIVSVGVVARGGKLAVIAWCVPIAGATDLLLVCLVFAFVILLACLPRACVVTVCDFVWEPCRRARLKQARVHAVGRDCIHSVLI